jgi:ADP-heptose:LPS heptosyltransferase
MKLPSNEQWLYFFNVLVSRFINAGKNVAAYSPKTILCVKWDEIGDMAACTHVFGMLKKRFPNARIDVIAKPYAAPLLQGNSAIDNVFTSIGDWKNRYDFVVELRGTWRSLFKSLRYYPTVRMDRGIVRLRNKGKQLHEVLTNYEIVKPVLGDVPFRNPEIFLSAQNHEKVDAFLAKNGIGRFCVVHAGARRELRKWTDSGFAQVCEWLFNEKQLPLVFVGVPEEEAQIRRITDQLNVPFYLATEQFSITDMAALISRSVLFWGNESGPLQVADALQIPAVGLFGPGVATVFYPRNANSAVVHHVLDCNPCDQIHCVRPENPCMHLITVAEVKAAIEKVVQ